ncbi:MAG TPA: disulfide bond formation protein B [Candidatus Megaira endosymbiont of Nemacystus decipiens]|nr:disulfide bond formation protein B [Candidatus Megaera endosymbiont of Nemacystus decipiens]
MNLKNHHILALAFSIISLSFAYYVEYILSLTPCPLCVYQRFPYLILLSLSIIGLSSDNNLYSYYACTFIASILMASYHAGIERKLWEMSSFCKPLISNDLIFSNNDFQNILYSSQIALCDKPSLLVLNLSMAEWNLIFNVFLLISLLYCRFKR